MHVWAAPSNVAGAGAGAGAGANDELVRTADSTVTLDPNAACARLVQLAVGEVPDPGPKAQTLAVRVASKNIVVVLLVHGTTESMVA